MQGGRPTGCRRRWVAPQTGSSRVAAASFNRRGPRPHDRKEAGMSFRQFPATGNDGNAYIIIEFHDQGGSDGRPSLRYELPDGQRLTRREKQFSNEDGTLVLTAD